MDRRQGVDRFDFHQHAFLDEKVETKANFQTGIALDDWHANLTLDVQASLPKLFREAGFIDRLEQARTEGAMHRQGRIHGYSSDPFIVFRHAPGPLRALCGPSCPW